jgi:hypothetical protein
METCKTAERNLTLKGFISLWKGYKAIKCTNCHLSFRHIKKKDSRRCYRRNWNIYWRNYYVKFKYNIRIQTFIRYYE